MVRRVWCGGLGTGGSAVFLAAVAVAACGTTRNYVIKNVPNVVRLEDTEFHGFEYVSTKVSDERMFVYGKIVHDHLSCISEGHVDLAAIGRGGVVAYAASLPLRHQGQRVHGAAGAAFRADLPYHLAPDEELHITFHGEQCTKDVVFDCRANRAAASQPETNESSAPRTGDGTCPCAERRYGKGSE